MRLHEYQAKRILHRYGVPVPRGELALSVDEAQRITAQLDRRVVLKAQVLTGGRGPAGGILLANDAAEAQRLAGDMLDMQIAGYPVAGVLVDEAIPIDHEIYIGITLDRFLAQPVIVASPQGGVEIADVARDMPERVYRMPIDPLLGLRSYQVRALAEEVGLAREHVDAFIAVALGLYRAFVDCDATLVEASPLVLTPQGEFYCLNSRIDVDDNALFRHRDLMDMRDESQDTPPERSAYRYGITYVRLGGHVGCLSNGAGLAMATLDQLRQQGVRPANFVDVGKGAGKDKVVYGLRLACHNSIEAVVINIFCSLTGCGEVAQGIAEGWKGLARNVPLVVRLDGVAYEEGQRALRRLARDIRSAPVVLAGSTGEAVAQVVALVQKEKDRQEAHSV